MKRWRAFLAAPAVLLAGAAMAQQDWAVSEHVLDNGLQVLVREDHRAPVAVAQIWYRVGSSYERRGETGISHLFEHMMFKGTERHPAGEFSEIISREGGRENAFTGRDYTAYFEILAADRLEIALELEADRMANLRIDAEALERERRVVLEERRLRTDDRPEGRFSERYSPVAHPASPYAHPIIGWADDIRNIDVDDLQAWYERWYTPANATLVVAGDVEPQAVFDLAAEHFGGIPGGPAPEVAAPQGLEAPGERRLTYRDPQARVPQLQLGYGVPSAATVESPGDAYALLMLSMVLDGGDGARLGQRLVRDQGIATAAGAGYGAVSRLDTQFSLYATPSGDDVEALESALRAEVEALHESPVSEEELERARSQLLADHLFELDSVFYQAMQIGMLETTGIGWESLERFRDRVQAVTAEDLQAAARRYLVPERLTVGVMLPAAQGDDA